MPDTSDKLVHVYGLCDPRDNHLIYVGVTSQPLKYRLRGHIGERRDPCGNKEKKVWIQSLLDAGLEPEIFLIETVPALISKETEHFWINYFHGLGCNLINYRGIPGRMAKCYKPWDQHRKDFFRFFQNNNKLERRGLPLLSYDEFALMHKKDSDDIALVQ